jgi:hypothetical protein
MACCLGCTILCKRAPVFRGHGSGLIALGGWQTSPLETGFQRWHLIDDQHTPNGTRTPVLLNCSSIMCAYDALLRNRLVVEEPDFVHSNDTVHKTFVAHIETDSSRVRTLARRN